MSNKTNEEKLRILKERLAQIKEKKEVKSTPIKPKEEIIEVTQIEKKANSFLWLKYAAIIIGIGYSSFYTYNNISINSPLTNNNTEKKDIIEKKLSYNLDLIGKNIAITATFSDEKSAKEMGERLNGKGFNADYFYLPNKSNSKEKVYKVFIGPYENKSETNQWTKNLELDFEIVQL